MRGYRSFNAACSPPLRFSSPSASPTCLGRQARTSPIRERRSLPDRAIESTTNAAREASHGVLFVLPAIIVLALLVAYPIVYTGVLSVTDNPGAYVGLKNFAAMAGARATRTAVWNTPTTCSARSCCR